MAQARAELIFVAGPQDGERGVLASNNVLLGRSTSCDVQVSEQAVSRQQARLELTPDGWVVQSLSNSNPLKINGKKYRAKKCVLVETGDVICIGSETEILFVSAGDDAEAAVGDYRLANPLQINPQAAAPVEAEVAEPATRPVATQRAFAPASLVADSQLDDAEEQDAGTLARKAKMRKYLIFGGIYVAVLLVVVVVLAMLNKPDESETRRREDRTFLKDRQIAEAIRAELTGKFTPNASDAAKALAKAREYYAGEIDTVGDLYRSVKYFKLYLAYHGSPTFANASDERMFLAAQDTLIRRVIETYGQAYTHERKEQWRIALDLFEQVQAMLPVNEEPRLEREHRVFRNVLGHMSYIRRRIQSIRKRK